MPGNNKNAKKNKKGKGKKKSDNNGMSNVQRKSQNKTQMPRRRKSRGGERSDGRQRLKEYKNPQIFSGRPSVSNGELVKNLEAPGQHLVVDLTLNYNPQSLWLIAATFVNHALSLGFFADAELSEDIHDYQMAFQVLFLDAMTGFTQKFDRAPYVFWTLVNSMTPKKKIIYRNMEYSFQFNPDRTRLLKSAVLHNIAFGITYRDPDNTPSGGGMHRYIFNDVEPKSLEDSVKFVQAIFTFMERKVPNLPRHFSHMNDCSIYSFGSKWLTGQKDRNFCDYSAANLEVPTYTHFLAKCSLGDSTYTNGQARFIASTSWGFGNACSHIGIRLQLDKMNERTFNNTTLNLKAYDLLTSAIQGATSQYFVNEKQKIANRPANAGPLPPGISNLDTYAYLRAYTIFALSGFAGSMAIWAGIGVGSFTAFKAGNIAEWATMGINETFNAKVAEEVRSLGPVYNSKMDEVIIVYPCMTNNSSRIFFTQWGNAFVSSTAYGGIDFDYCNLSTPSFYYNLTAGSAIRTSNAMITEQEAVYSGIQSTSVTRSPGEIAFSISTKAETLTSPMVNEVNLLAYKGRIAQFLKYAFKFDDTLIVAFTAALLQPPRALIPYGSPEFSDTTYSYDEGTLLDIAPMNQSLGFEQALMLPIAPPNRLDLSGNLLYTDNNIYRMLHHGNSVLVVDPHINDVEPVYVNKISQLSGFQYDAQGRGRTENMTILDNRSDKSQGGALASINPSNGFLGFLDKIVGFIPGVNMINDVLDQPVKMIKKIVDDSKHQSYAKSTKQTSDAYYQRRAIGNGPRSTR